MLEIVKNIFPSKVNMEIVKILQLTPGWSFIITSKISEQLSLNFNKLQRVNYNFYHPLSKGKPHIDYDNNKFYTILYNLNTNDGYTSIENKKYKSNESEALVFNSNKVHYGSGPTEGLRYNLNIVFS